MEKRVNPLTPIDLDAYFNRIGFSGERTPDLDVRQMIQTLDGACACTDGDRHPAQTR